LLFFPIYGINGLKTFGSTITATQPPTFKQIFFLKCPVHAVLKIYSTFFLAANLLIYDRNIDNVKIKLGKNGSEFKFYFGK
jgi:hypothetical protein